MDAYTLLTKRLTPFGVRVKSLAFVIGSLSFAKVLQRDEAAHRTPALATSQPQQQELYSSIKMEGVLRLGGFLGKFRGKATRLSLIHI